MKMNGEISELDQVDEKTLDQLHARLASESDRTGVLGVAYRRLDTPIGSLLLASTPLGVVRIAFSNEHFDEVLQELSDKVSPAVLEAPAQLDQVARELDEYFSGRRRAFDLPTDLRLSKGFRRKVLLEMSEIPFGSTVTYQGLAIEAGSPNATRAVGSACATNPIPILLPCHRVLRSDGSLGGYRGGLEAKRLLLDLEASK